jgi:predicted lactoylglutathione lyase/AcrR family transcriptional regulator
LRERKKMATRAALSEVALRLTVERGLDRVRVEDIAAEVGVSPRTFNNYFSSKEEAIVGSGMDRAASMRAALRARPAGEPLWQAVSHTVTEMFPGGEEPDRAWVAKVQVVKATPALMAARLRSDASVERALAEVIAERTGTEVERDLYPRLAAAAVIATVRAALDYWLEVPAAATLRSTVASALQQVAAGLPTREPASASASSRRDHPMPVKLAINLPVKKLDRSVGFFTQLGFSVNPQLSSDTTAHLVISDEISAILIAEELFNNISRRHVADTATSAEVIVQLQLGTRERVDELVDAAISAGGQVANPPNDQGFLYGRSFVDLDGHQWDAFHVDVPVTPHD